MSTHQEILDVVDDYDQIIGQSSFVDCHRLGLRHRAVHLEIYSDVNQQQILILRRAETKANDAGRLEIPGGHVKAGESYHVAAARELNEEIGLQIELKQTVPDYNESDDEEKNFHNRESIMVFTGYWPGDPKTLRLDPNEVSSAQWFSADAICRQTEQEPKSVNSALRLFAKRWRKKQKLP